MASKPGAKRHGGNQENDRAARHQQFAPWQNQLDHQRDNRRHHQNRADPQTDVARPHQRRIKPEGKHIVAGVLKTIEISRNAQVEFGIKAEDHAGDNGNGERDQQSGAVHAGFV